MRKALVVGINHYTHNTPLYGCVDDAHRVKAILERHSDGTINFDVRLLTGTGPTDAVSRAQLRETVRELFEGQNDTVLFYFAGHGYIEATGGYLCATDSATGDDGLAISDLMIFANKSHAQNKIILLDSCFGGIAGTPATDQSHAQLADGITILTASTKDQYATEQNGEGVFTNLLVDALGGAAGNLVGDVTPGGVYAHIDQSLGPWEQRPVFKTNVKSFVSLRKVQPPLALADLRQIAALFPTPGYEFPLDPTYEPESENPDPAKTQVFRILQMYNRVNLLVPLNAPHMWHAAMGSHSCGLTVLGEHYRRLVARGRI